MFESAMQGLAAISAPEPLGFLVLGVVLGVWGGALPGVGGPAQLAVLLPFAMLMSPINAIGFLIGVTTVGQRSRTRQRYMSPVGRTGAATAPASRSAAPGSDPGSNGAGTWPGVSLSS